MSSFIELIVAYILNEQEYNPYYYIDTYSFFSVNLF